MTTKQDMVNAARERLLEYGWTQRSMQDADGSMCIMGALYVSTDYDVVLETLEDLRDILGGSITQWNDMPGRTFNDVMEALDQLALRVKEEK